MRPRSEGAATMPDHLHIDNEPDDPDARSAWSRERIAWAKEHGASVIDLLREQRRRRANPPAKENR